MADFTWAKLLQQWNDRVFNSSWVEELPDDVRSAKWLGFLPATETQITAVEQRLGIPLPPSYRAFLKVSNGWRRLTHAIDHVWGTDEIQWFKHNHREWIAAYTEPSPYGSLEETPDEDYFSYETSTDFKPNHLKETLQVSDVGDAAVFLLNPQVISQDGEWEAWFLANWVPGVERYRSFQELIECMYHQFCNREWKQPEGVIGGLPNEYIGAPGSPKRHLKKRRRWQAVKVLEEPVDRWDFEELLTLLHHEDWEIRREVAWGLGKLKDPRAIEPLLSLVDDDSNASVTAMYALKVLAPEQLREPLLEVLRKRHFFGCTAAAMVLAELKEPRAIPVLVEMVKDTSPSQRDHCDTAGTLLAGFGSAGFDALVGLLSSDDLIVRDRAAGSLCYTKDPRTIDVLRQLLSDAEPRIRDNAALSLKFLNASRASN